MPTPFLLTPRALNDLGDILEYIAEDSVRAANRVESAIFRRAIALPDTPCWAQNEVKLRLCQFDSGR